MPEDREFQSDLAERLVEAIEDQSAKIAAQTAVIDDLVGELQVANDLAQTALKKFNPAAIVKGLFKGKGEG